MRLRRFPWLTKEERGWTSVSFLLDRQGVIRHIHPGGQYVRGDGSFEEVERTLQTILDEPT